MTASLGFLSVRRHPEHGYFGGYLITNFSARPLEFHCTMPVKPSRAQELLYGPTMDAFVCGEQIAKALVAKAKVKPVLVLTNCSAVLAMVSASNMAVAELQFAESQRIPSFELPTGSAGQFELLKTERWQFALMSGQADTKERITQVIAQLGSNFDLTEPFQRVTEALLEAHPIARAA